MNQSQSRREQLGQELQRLRNLSGLSGRALADRLEGINQVTVSRAENGKTKLSRAQVELWALATGASTEERERLLALLDAAVRDESSWRRKLGDRKHLQDEIRAKEAAAHTVRNFQPTIIPGLMQTPEYANYIIPRVDIENVVDHSAAAASRLERQQILFEGGRRFEFLLGEAALRWPASRPDILAAQMDRIVTVAQLESVNVAVLPLGEPADAIAWSNFVIFEGEESFVEIELTHPLDTVTEVHRVDLYRWLYSKLWEAAVKGVDAVALVQRVAAEMRSS